MTIYDGVTRNGNPRNPAKALYSHWHSILKVALERNGDGRLVGNINYGPTEGMHIGVANSADSGPDARPNLVFGKRWNPFFELTATGEFRLVSDFTGGWGYSGYSDREAVTRYTFLRWSHIARDYVWWVDTEAIHGGFSWSSHGESLKDWTNKVPYFSERSLSMKSYGWKPHWNKLVQVDGVWTIQFSRVAASSWDATSQAQLAPQCMAQFEALREKRYRRAGREHLIATGILTRRERSVVDIAKIEEGRERTLQAIIANMNVGMAARTTPLPRRATEEVR